MSEANESTGDDQEHTPLRQGRERAELLHGWQRRGAGELREPLGKGLVCVSEVFSVTSCGKEHLSIFTGQSTF